MHSHTHGSLSWRKNGAFEVGKIGTIYKYNKRRNEKKNYAQKCLRIIESTTAIGFVYVSYSTIIWTTLLELDRILDYRFSFRHKIAAKQKKKKEFQNEKYWEKEL